MIVTPEEVFDYTTFDTVKQRNPDLLKLDILEAKSEIGSLLETSEIPENLEVRLAIMKLAQFYALVNQDEELMRGNFNESIGDYSYTMADGSTLQKPDIKHLLRNFLPKGTTFRMRSI